MNRILSNNFCSTSTSLFRNYSIKSTAAPSFRNFILAKTPVQPPINTIVCKPIVYQLLSSSIFRQFRQSKQQYASYAPINIDARNLTKDVIVYKYNNPRFFKLMNIFAIVQFFFWLICSEFTLSTLRDTPIDETDPNINDKPIIYRVNLGEDKYKYGIATATFFLGFGILSFVWIFTLRSVRFLVLRKGGHKVSFVTYGPFGTNRITEVPITCISAVQSRELNASALPLKVRGKRWHFLLDNRGEYTNPKLFDHVINVRRRFA